MAKQYYLYCFFVFVTSSKGAKIYIIDIPENGIKSNPTNTIHNLESNFYPYASDVVNDRPSLLNNNNNVKDDKTKRITTCDRYFGSMFGTKLQKLQCIYSLIRDKNSRFAQRTTKRFSDYFDSDSDSYERPMYNYQNVFSKYVNKGKNFEDLTRGNGQFANDFLDERDLAKSGESSDSFASNYVDVNDLRVGKLSDYTDYLDSNFDKPLKEKHHIMKKHQIAGAGKISRKAGANPFTPKDNKIVSADTDESTSSDSSDSSELKIQRSIKKYKKPKRFQVIKNSESNESGSKPVTSSESEEPRFPVASAAESDKSNSGTTSEEVPRKKRKKKVEEPILSDVDDKFVYIQGRNRQYGLKHDSDIDSDADTRKRMQHFLPKRYHWDEEDIPNLGYFWLGGIKGS